MREYECIYKNDIESLKSCVGSLNSEIKVMAVEIKGIKEDIAEIKQKINNVTNIKSDVEYLKGKDESERMWSRVYLGIIKDLTLICLMAILSLKMVWG